MALRAPSMFLYGFQVTENNRSLDFKATSGGSELMATLKVGYYSLTSLMTEVRRALFEADPNHVYAVTADRTVSGGTENRLTIQTSGAYLDLLFSSGIRAASNCADLLGFAATDQTGALTYTGSKTCGTSLTTDWPGWNYLSPDLSKKNFGTLNITASGRKEAIVFSTQRFFEVQFKFIREDDVESWADLLTWLISQRAVDFTPEVTSPNKFYESTLESTGADGSGLAFTIKEMLPMAFHYDTGMLKFRVKE